MDEYVVLVNKHDEQIGIAEKLQSHREGLRHRAFSVILTNGSRILLQQRSDKKYHSPGLWANAACGHPRPGESLKAAADRRLNEEIGASCDLNWGAVTQYSAPVGNAMIENEVVHLFFGEYDGPFNLNPDEASDWQWIDRELLYKTGQDANRYTYWLRDYLKKELL